MTREERQERDNQIIAYYYENEGTSLQKVGEKFGMTKQGISLIFKKNNVTLDFLDDKVVAWCKGKDINEISLESVAKKFNICRESASRILCCNNIAHSRSKQKRVEKLVDRILALDTKNKTVSQIREMIADKNGYPSETTMFRLMKDYDIPHKHRKSYNMNKNRLEV